MPLRLPLRTAHHARPAQKLNSWLKRPISIHIVMLIFGLSGGIASGKSSVTRILRERGIHVIDCDEIAKEVVQPGKWGYRRVIHAFGTGVSLDSGQLDREKLGKLIFDSKPMRDKLNKATHLPVFVQLVWRIVLSWLRLRPLVVIDMPLLFETGSHRYCSKSIVVYCSKQQQIERIMTRDGPSRTLEDATARVEAQMPLAVKREKATFTIDNSGSPADLIQQIDLLLKSRMRRSRWSIRSLLLSPVAVGLGLVFAVMIFRGHG
jgi:dephospho-CoA kinase